jgi:2,5-diketo-D-gluconate reductase B
MERLRHVGPDPRAFGTWPLRGAACRDAVTAALAVGHRAFDTAQMYGNEAEVGAALAESGLPRSALFVTTKVHPDAFAPDRFLPSVERSLRDLRLDRVDLLLLHWPPAGGDVAPSLRLLDRARALGLAAHVGVSNYTVAMMRTARAVIEGPVAANQVEFHPLLDQSRLLAGSAETGIPLSSYCSVARGRVVDHPALAAIGAPRGKTAAQVALRWILHKGVSLNVMSTRPANIRANFEIMDFALTDAEIARVDALGATGLRLVDRPAVPWAPDWD